MRSSRCRSGPTQRPWPPFWISMTFLAASLVMACPSHAAEPGPAGGDTVRVRPAPGGTRLAPGSIVRLEERAAPSWSLRAGASFRGTLLRASSDSLRVIPEGEGQARSVAIQNMRSIHVLGGRSHFAGALAGTVLGALAGAGVGLLAAGFAVAQDPDEEMAGFASIYFPLVGVAIGAPAGGVIGGVRGLEYWERVR